MKGYELMNNNLLYSDMKPADVRKLISDEKITWQTSGMCSGYAQANLVVLPERDAYDFLLHRGTRSHARYLKFRTQEAERFGTLLKMQI